MDPALLSRLPDTVKLGILRHFWADSTENQVVPLPPQQPEESQAAQEGVSPSPATATATSMQRDEPAAATTVEDSCAHTLVQQRRLDGGLAVIDGFLNGAVVEAVRDEAQAVLAVHSRGAGMVAACAAAQGSAEVPHVWTSAASRGDRAAWLSLTDLQASGRRRLADAVQSLLALRPWLQQQGYDVGGRPSLQLACYPGGGARYVRHRDASASVPHRTVTAILYLNPGWEASHGGCLCVYNHSTAGSDPRAASAADLRLTRGTAADSSNTIGRPPGMATGQHTACEQATQQAQAAPFIGSGLDEGHCATVVPPLGGRLVVMDSRLLHEVLPAGAERYALTAWFSRASPPRQQRRQAQEQQQPLSRQLPEQKGQAAGATVQKPCDVRHHEQAEWPGRQPAPAPALDAAAVTSPGCIFVSIPAYRDSEAQWTMADLFAKAAHPGRVRVGIVWQVELPGDAGFVRLAGDQRWLPQVRQVVLPAGEASGPCKARALAQQLWEGEEFHLQIDSHMRFAQGWDAVLLRVLRQAEAAAGHPRVVLSTYPPGYEGEGPAATLPPDPLPAVLCASHFGERDGLLRTVGRKLREPLAAPAPALFWAAGFSFSRAQLMHEAPYSRDLPGLFFGEELLQLQRMWCAGWDVYTPPTAVAYHLWSRQHRPTFRDEQRVDSAEQQRRSQHRVVAALSGEGEGPCGDGGSGSGCGGRPWRRSLERFWKHVGVDFRPGSRAISDRARNGGWPAEAFLTLDSCTLQP